MSYVLEKWKILWHEVIRDELGRFVTWRKALMWRRAIAMNWRIKEKRGKGVPLHRKYYSVRVQAWAYRKEDLPSFDELEERLYAKVAEFLGYPPEEWWFIEEIGKATQQVPYDPDLEGVVEEEVEELD